jgi:hypothetical protein
MILGMRFLQKYGCKGSAAAAEAAAAPENTEEAVIFEEGGSEGAPHLLRTVGWVSAALGAVALGLIVGRELRQRYKFNRRTPYDLYAHSGDELPDVDFGVGI